jgi:histidyl-tRNA synthetase
MVENGLDIAFELYLDNKSISKTIMDFSPKNFKKHLKNCDKYDVKYCVLVGEDEIQNQTVWIKNLETKEEKTIPYEDIKNFCSNC